MSILDSLPHLATAKTRTTNVDDTLGGTKESFPTIVFTDRACWRQNARDNEIREFEKVGISVTDKFYFTSDPGLDENHVLDDVRDEGDEAGTGDGPWEVRSRAEPDASVGLGYVYRVFAEKTTVGTT